MDLYIDCFSNKDIICIFAKIMKFICSLLCVLFCLHANSQSIGIDLDGNDDYIQSTYMGVTGTTARTVEAWIQTSANADPNNGGIQQVITDWGTMTTGARFTLNVLFNNGLRIEVQGSGLNSTKAINDGQWHHVAAVFDPNATYKYRLLVDGVLDTFGNISTTLNTVSGVAFTIGRRIDNIHNFLGKIDEVRVFNYARTDSAIKADMRKEFCSSTSGLVAYYKLNEGTPNSNSNTSKNTATDYSGNSNTGTLNNFTLRGTSSNWVNGAPIVGKTTSSVKVFACSTYLIPSKKRTLSSSGTYLDTISNRIGCDSIITIALSIGKSNRTVNIFACDSFKTPKGQVTYSNAFISETYQSYRNCDSIVNFNVVINKRFLAQINATVCDSFTSKKGKVFKNSSQFSDTFKTKSFCDSIFVYNIIINQSKQSQRSLSACDSIRIYNNKYTQSQTLKFTFKSYLNCDSTETILLTINKSKLNQVNITACDSFVSPSGIVYKQSGLYTEKYRTYTFCDSLVQYQVNVNKHFSVVNNLKSCKRLNFQGKWYDTSIVITENLKTIKGCDSIIKTVIVVTKIDTSVSSNGVSLTCKDKTADGYAWLNCATNQLVPNEAKPFFMPGSYSGRFAAIIQRNNCFDTSSCYFLEDVSVSMQSNSQFVSVYPNPNSGEFSIQVNSQIVVLSIELFDALGQRIDVGFSQNNSVFQNSKILNSGVYSIRINTNFGPLFSVLNVQ